MKNKRNPFQALSQQKIKDRQLKKKDEWIQSFETFEDTNSHSENQKRKFLGLAVEPRKLKWWLFFLIICLLILSFKILYLQIVKGNYYQELAEGNRIRIKYINAIRGIIYDRNYEPLVKNIPRFSLAIIPVDLPKDSSARNEIIKILAEIIAQNESEITKKISEVSPFSYQPLILKEGLSYSDTLLIRVKTASYPGIEIKIESDRIYLKAEEIPTLSHLIGYLGKIEKDKIQDYLNKDYLLNDSVGKAGLEFIYEGELKGKNGQKQIEVDALGEEKKILAIKPAEAGNNLILTIDSRLQEKLQQALTSILRVYGKTKGAAVVLDPNNGEILALVSLPAFDNNLFSSGIKDEELTNLIENPNKPLFNRAIGGKYPPGSTFKPIVAAAALQEGIIDAQTKFESVGGIKIDKWFFPDWKEEGHGWTNVTRAIAESINTFFYIIGGGLEDFSGLGVTQIKKYAEFFGLNQKLGIDLPGEATGFLPTKEWKEKEKREIWYVGDTYHLAIGQGDILVTPLQVAIWTSVFANGGILYQPHLVKEIIDSQNKLVKEFTPQILKKDFIKKEYIEVVRQGLREGVTYGSSKELLSLPFTTAGKTGTAQWSEKFPPHAWFTVFAPYQNPKIVITILIEEGGEGSKVALPVAKEVLEWWFLNY